MVDVGNRESWGNFTIMNLQEDEIEGYMNTWLDRIMNACEQYNISINVKQDEFKLPNMARSMGGIISFIGKLASNAVKGYTIEDATNKKSVYYRIHLVPQFENPGTIVNVYCETWFNTEFGNKKAMGEALFNSISEIINNTFNDMGS